MKLFNLVFLNLLLLPSLAMCMAAQEASFIGPISEQEHKAERRNCAYVKRAITLTSIVFVASVGFISYALAKPQDRVLLILESCGNCTNLNKHICLPFNKTDNHDKQKIQTLCPNGTITITDPVIRVHPFHSCEPLDEILTTIKQECYSLKPQAIPTKKLTALEKTPHWQHTKNSKSKIRYKTKR